VTGDGEADATGVEHAEELLAFADAAVGTDDAALERARAAAVAALGPEAFVDAAAIAANFQRMVRIADGTGIPLDTSLDLMSADIRDELGLEAFGSSANTPGAGALVRTAGRVLRPLAFGALRLLGSARGKRS
jgi:hypothetical protein